MISPSLSPSSLSECTRLRRCIGIVVARHSGYCSGRSEAIKRRRIMRTRLSFDPLSMTESLTSRGDRRVSNGRTRRLYVTGHRLHPIHLFLHLPFLFSYLTTRDRHYAVFSRIMERNVDSYDERALDDIGRPRATLPAHRRGGARVREPQLSVSRTSTSDSNSRTARSRF